MSTSIHEAAIQPSIHLSIAPAPAASVDPPPTNANIPTAPDSFTPAAPGEFRNVAPRQSELAAMPQALLDLAKLAGFEQVLGTAGLTQAEVEQCLEVASAWSSMRQATSKWDAYCVLQEGYAWRAMRALVARLGPAFELASLAKPALVTTCPGLAALLGAKKAIAQKGASTRRMNKAAKAKGEPEIHGVVGRKRELRAAKAALAKAASAMTATPTLPAATALQGNPSATDVPGTR